MAGWHGHKTSEFKDCKRASKLAFLLAAVLVFGVTGCSTDNNSVTNTNADKGINYQRVCKTYHHDDGTKRRTYYDYDQTGNVVRETEHENDGSISQIVKTEYDDQGRCTLKTTEHYDASGNFEFVEKEIYEEGACTSSSDSYYRGGKLYQVTVCEYTLNDDGDDVEITLKGPNKDSLTESSRRVITSTVDDDGTKHRIAHDQQGEIEYSEATKKDEQGNLLLYESRSSRSYELREYEYEDGKVTHSIEKFNDSSADDGISMYERRYHYDESGNCVFREDLGSETMPGDGCYCFYDSNGNIVQAATVSKGELSKIDTHIYDETGVLLTEWTEDLDSGDISNHKTYEYRSTDDSKYISGEEYDVKKYYAQYVDNHFYGEYLLMDIRGIYSEYGSDTLEDSFLSAHVQPEHNSGSFLEFDESINHVTLTGQALSLNNEAYVVSLPEKWVGKVIVSCEGPLWTTYDLYYLSEKSNRLYRLMKINYTTAEELGEEADDAGDIGFTKALSLDGKDSRLDVYVTTAFEFWYENKTAANHGVDSLSDEEKQEFLDLLYDGNTLFEELCKAESPDTEKYLDFSQSEWTASMKNSFKIES